MNQLYYGESVLPIPKPITTSSHPTAVSTIEDEATCRKYHGVQGSCWFA